MSYRKGLLLAACAVFILTLGGWLRNLLIDQTAVQSGAFQQLIGLMAIPAEAEPNITFDIVRQFIHRHSRHEADALFAEMRGKAHLFAEKMIDHALGQTPEPVHMECSTRSTLMAKVLQTLGYKTRIVYVFDTDPTSDGKLRSHTFLDAFNPATSTWESHDPDYNAFWKSAEEGKRISVFDAAEDLSEIEPCNQAKCGWSLVSDEGRPMGKVYELVDIVSVVDKANKRRVSRFTTRANLNTEFHFNHKRGNFCEIFPKLCSDIVQDGIAAN